MKKFKYFDKEEKELIEEIEKYGKPAKNSEELMRKAVVMASNTLKRLKKDKTVTIRISSNILNTIKTKAQKQGIPYQTLLGSLIHQYADDRIKLKVL